MSNVDIDVDAATATATANANATASGTERERERLRLQAVLGNLSSEEVLTSTVMWASPRPQLLVFVSSTFTDTHRERNLLLEKILLDLRRQGASLGIEAVFVDMRYGVQDDNTLHHDTWVACKRELMRCYNESAGLFFLSLQGDKYGYRPLPRCLSVSVVESALARASDEDKVLLEEWYTFDENGQEYLLKPLVTLSDSNYWGNVLPKLRGLLEGCEFGEGSDLVVGQSVTEWEARYAFQLARGTAGGGDVGNVDVDRLFWSHKHFDGGVTLQQDPKKELDDGESDKLDALKNHMRQTLGCSSRLHEMSITAASYLAKDQAWNDYMTEFEENMRLLFQSEFDKIVETKRQWAVDGCGVGMEGDEL